VSKPGDRKAGGFRRFCGRCASRLFGYGCSADVRPVTFGSPVLRAARRHVGERPRFVGLEGFCEMGRAGIEPATLGLKVRAEPRQQTALRRNCLQRPRVDALTNGNELQVVETRPYSHSYSRPSSDETTEAAVHGDESPLASRAGSARASMPSVARPPPPQPGGMFWFSRKTFVGSYRRLTATRRSQVGPG
jgi:hypothetical protein